METTYMLPRGLIFRVTAVAICLSVGAGCDNFVDGYYTTAGSSTGGASGGTSGGAVGSDSNALLVANYNDGSTTKNSLGADIVCDNCTLSSTGTQLQFQYTGSGSYFGVSNALRNNWCEYDLSIYSTLSFDLQASSGGTHTVQIILHQGDGTCPKNASNVATWNVQASATLQTFTVALSRATALQDAISIEMDPQLLDTTLYTLDNVQIVP